MQEKIKMVNEKRAIKAKFSLWRTAKAKNSTPISSMKKRKWF